MFQEVTDIFLDKVEGDRVVGLIFIVDGEREAYCGDMAAIRNTFIGYPGATSLPLHLHQDSKEVAPQ